MIDLLHHDMNGQTTGIIQLMKIGKDKHEDWQRQTCELLRIWFIHPFQLQDGAPDAVLTRPDLCSLRSVAGDGNCLFRTLCYIITGSKDSAIVAHMRSIPELVSGIGPDGNRNYLVTYDDGNSSWVIWLKTADFETTVLTHLLNTPVYSFQEVPCFLLMEYIEAYQQILMSHQCTYF